MPEIANARGLNRLLGDMRRTEAGGALVREGADRWRPANRLRAAREMLDGIGGLGWSVIGFVGGAVFWHFVGFWAFVSDVVLAGGPGVALTARAPVAGLVRQVGPADVPDPSVSLEACTVLVLDRRTGATSARACDRVHVALPADSFEGREDRAPGQGAFAGAPRPPGQR